MISNKGICLSNLELGLIIKNGELNVWDILHSPHKPPELNPEALLIGKSALSFCQQKSCKINPPRKRGLRKYRSTLAQTEGICPWAQKTCPCEDAKERIAKCGMSRGRWLWRQDAALFEAKPERNPSRAGINRF